MILFAMIALTLFCACSKWDGDPVTKEFGVSGTYTELTVSDAFDVTVSDEVSQITVTAGDNIMSKVRVEIVEGELKIYLKGWTVSHSDMKVVLPYNPGLRSINLSGASELRSSYVVSGTDVDIELSGSSSFYGFVEADELDLDLSGASDATIEGVVAKLHMNLSGSSDLEKKVAENRYSLTCDRCECSISGSSSAYIHCDGTIKGSVSGSSDLHFTGNASTAACNASGSSDIIHDVL